MTSYQALHRQAARRARRDQIRREVAMALAQAARCEAGDPEALARYEAGLVYAEPGPEMQEQRPRRPRGRCGRVRWSWRRFWRFEREPRRPFGPACDEADYPAPEPFDREYERHLRAVAAGEEPGYFGMTPEWAAELLAAGMRPAREPSWAPLPGESDRAYHRRTGRPNLAEKRAALLLARGYWNANCPLPGAIRQALYAVSLSPRALRLALERVALGKEHRAAEQAPDWAALARGRDLPILQALLSGRGALHALFARRSETWALVRGPGWSRITPAGAVALAVLTGAASMPP